jgi:hypothetical protein
MDTVKRVTAVAVETAAAKAEQVGREPMFVSMSGNGVVGVCGHLDVRCAGVWLRRQWMPGGQCVFAKSLHRVLQQMSNTDIVTAATVAAVFLGY